MVFGTRPEAIKLWPVVQELRHRGVRPTIVASGRHTDLLAGTPAADGMLPDVSCRLASQNDPLAYSRVCAERFGDRWRGEAPDLVVVQGDTATAHAGAVAASGLGIPVAHVEAGIRSGDVSDPWPEEGFRRRIDALSGWRFAPTSRCRDLLTGEHLSECVVTGNTGIDALYQHTVPLQHPAKMQDRVLVTLHRRESFGAPLRGMVDALRHAAVDYPSLEFLWPVHPNPHVVAATRALEGPCPPNLVLISPLGMVPFARLLSRSRVVLTDSGGVQEEAAALGVPALIARDLADRPESITAGLAKLTTRTPTGIAGGFAWALGFHARCTPSDCFGDGHAAPQIVDHLLELP